MKKRILYYPNINITNDVWLRNAVIYWEEVSSIMPYQDDDYEISPDIIYLMSTGNFIPTRPDEIMMSDLYEDFIMEVEHKFNDYKPSFSSFSNRECVHKSKFKTDLQSIHRTKLSYDIIDLIQKKSNINLNDNEQWVMMDKGLSDIYMSVLAKYLAAISYEDTSIGTDRVHKQDKIFKPKDGICDRNNRQSFLNYRFSSLPVPNSDVPFEDILEFKEKRKDELIKFRVEIDEFEKKLGVTEDIVEIKKIFRIFEDKLNINIRDLNTVMKECNWGILESVMKGLVSFSIPNIVDSVENIGLNINPLFKWMSAASASTLSFQLSINEVGRIKNKAISENPFAYIYYGKREKIIK